MSEIETQATTLTVRFAGDSGDGIQLTGGRYTLEAAISGADLATFPDFPAEIRAPAGTTFGVSAFQIQFGARTVHTPGDYADLLVALNPAALKANLGEVRPHGTIVVDTDAFTEKNLLKAGYADNPLDDGSLDTFRVIALAITKLTKEAVAGSGATSREATRARNFWTLGLVLWLTGRERQATRTWIEQKFAGDDAVLAANLAALDAGHAHGETIELARVEEPVTKRRASPLPPGQYRGITGADGICLGLAAGAHLAGIEMVYGSYPITPASTMLHGLSRLGAYGIQTYQAEDEIAAIGVAIGASYAGKLGVTGTSGPGMALKTEAIGLAIATELPLVIIDAQRGGPSTGLPTKTEQSDLFQAIFGRNGDAPLPVIAAATPGDCFDCAIEAVRLATKYMTPVILLTDGYLANASEPWLIPDLSTYSPFPVRLRKDPNDFKPYARNPDTLARDWVAAGTPGMHHRIGGLERADLTGDVSYDPSNHQRMTQLRKHKVCNIADDLPPLELNAGSSDDRLLVVGWGSTYGALASAVDELRNEGVPVAHAHLRHVWPLPSNLKSLLTSFAKVLVPELNTGQLAFILQGHGCRPVCRYDKVAGRPFTIDEIKRAVRAHLEG